MRVDFGADFSGVDFSGVDLGVGPEPPEEPSGVRDAGAGRSVGTEIPIPEGRACSATHSAP